MCVQNKKSYLCRLKINQALGSDTCVYSCYTSPDGSEHYLQQGLAMVVPINMHLKGVCHETFRVIF
jgi:hypothetical protein